MQCLYGILDHFEHIILFMKFWENNLESPKSMGWVGGVCCLGQRMPSLMWEALLFQFGTSYFDGEVQPHSERQQYINISTTNQGLRWSKLLLLNNRVDTLLCAEESAICNRILVSPFLCLTLPPNNVLLLLLFLLLFMSHSPLCHHTMLWLFSFTLIWFRAHIFIFIHSHVLRPENFTSKTHLIHSTKYCQQRLIGT